MQRPLVTDLAALRDKYRRLLVMRRESEAYAARGVFRLTGEAQRERHTRARKIAARFPGALRELDALDAEGLAARLAEVEAELGEAREHPGRVRPRRRWIRLVLDYHAEVRAALAAKRARLARLGVMERVWKRLARRYRRPIAELKAIVYPDS
jgi:hypothetical protein